MIATFGIASNQRFFLLRIFAKMQNILVASEQEKTRQIWKAHQIRTLAFQGLQDLLVASYRHCYCLLWLHVF
jgi:hypothetical protein